MADKTLKQARQYLQGRIVALTDAPVYEYMPVIKTPVEMADYFGTTNAAGDKVYNGWAIVGEGTENQSDTEEGEIDYTFNRIYGLVFHGWYGVASGEEYVTFSDQSEALINGLDEDPTLGGNCDEALPSIVRNQDQRTLGGVLCHHIEITLALRMRRDRLA